MATVLDDEFGAFGEGGAGVAVDLSGFREGAESIDVCDAAGGFFQFGEVDDDLLAELEEQFVFELLRALLGTEYFVFHLFERRSDVALSVRHGLFARVVVGNFGELRGGDFDEISEDVVELDFQGIDSRAFAFVFLETGDPIFSAACCGAEFIELWRITVADDVAFLDVGRWFVGEGGFEEGGEFGKRMKMIDD